MYGLKKRSSTMRNRPSSIPIHDLQVPVTSVPLPESAEQQQGKEEISESGDQLQPVSSPSGATDEDEKVIIATTQCAVQEQGNEVVPGPGGQQLHVPFSSGSTEENEEMIIATIRATDVSLGLRRLPAGFSTVVHHNGLEWRTANKLLSVNDDVIEWSDPIPIPSDLSTTVRLEIYASFEIQPLLGVGEQLRELTTSVEQLLDHSARGIPFNFSPKDGDIVSPCSSVLVIIERRKRKQNCSPTLTVLAPYCTAPESQGELEDATNHGHSALSRYQKQGEKRDLDRSIEAFERALNICPVDHPCRAAVQSNLAMTKLILCQVGDMDVSLDVPLRLYRDALSARPVGHPDRPSTLIHLAAVHFARCQKQRDHLEETQAGVLLHEVMQLSGTKSHEHRAAAFMHRVHAGRSMGPVRSDDQLSTGQNPMSFSADSVMDDFNAMLIARFHQFGDLTALQQAIANLQTLVRSTTSWDVKHCARLGNLGSVLTHRFERLGELRDLEDGISAHRDAVRLIPHDHADKLSHHHNLGVSLRVRFQHLGELRDLEEAISTQRDAVLFAPYGHPRRPCLLGNLGSLLAIRFEHLGELCDLEDAILANKDAVDLTPHGHPDKPGYLCDLGSFLSTRFQRLGNLCDLEDAISMQRNAADLTPHGHLDKPLRLNGFSVTLITRFKRFGELRDLEDAIATLRGAIDLAPPNHRQMALFLNNLGVFFISRFERLAELRDLEEAISTLKDAVRLTPHSRHDKPLRLANLAVSLNTRFQRLGELHDLDEAISALKDAVHLTPQNHPNKPDYLHNLGISLRTRFERQGELGDLEDAISAQRDAVHLTPHGHPRKFICLNSLSSSFFTRFKHCKELCDLEDTISIQRDVVNLTPPGHPQKPYGLNNLGISLRVRFEHLGELRDLEEAISTQKRAIDLTPHGHPQKPSCLDNLGNSFTLRFERLGEPRDLENAISLYSHAASFPVGPIGVRFHASQKWISCARLVRHRTLPHAYSVALALLPQLAWIGLSLTHRYEQLSQGIDVVREAAAVALDLGLPETAVEWLEQGRSVVWGELLQLRSSFEDLSSAHPDHARRLRELSTELEHAGVAREKTLSAMEQAQGVARYATASSREADKHRTLAIERDELLQEIRRLPGFEQFLLRKRFAHLRGAAHSGPVVILNAAESRCDALIVLADMDHVIHVPLPHLTFQRSNDLQNILKGFVRHTREGRPVPWDDVSWESILSPLWKSIVKPVLDAIALVTPGELSRIFWCPTGPLAFLPIHAAGVYDSDYSQPGHKIFDLVISSYVPTLSILLGLPSPDVACTSDDLRFLAVRQPSSDGHGQLDGVPIELGRIKEVIKNSPLAGIALVESRVGTVEEVLTLMKDTDWVHFACHGVQDGAESGLCLADRRRLKLRDILALSRPRGGLAFLSACQTATGETRLSDEAIHVAAGMLFAGYGGVVGTMWSISDGLAPDVARDVYVRLFGNGARPDYRRAARALHDATGDLRDRGVSFSEWVPFIHVGL